MIEMTDSAIAHFKNVTPCCIVKFGVEGGGCAGFQYYWKALNALDEKEDDDIIQEFDGLTVVLDGLSLMFVIGTKIDFIEDITGSSIKIENPNSKSSCGCGISANFDSLTPPL